MASASIARAEPDAPRQTLRPRDVAKAPALPTRRPLADSASLALLLGGLVALWRTAERHTFNGHAPRHPHRFKPKGHTT